MVSNLKSNIVILVLYNAEPLLRSQIYTSFQYSLSAGRQAGKPRGVGRVVASSPIPFPMIPSARSRTRSCRGSPRAQISIVPGAFIFFSSSTLEHPLPWPPPPDRTTRLRARLRYLDSDLTQVLTILVRSTRLYHQ